MDNDIYRRIADYNDWVCLQPPAGGAVEMEKLKGGKMSYYEWWCLYCGKYNQYEGITQKTYICQYCGKENKEASDEE